MTTMTDAQVLGGVSSGMSDAQLLGGFATQPQIDAARRDFANRAPQAPAPQGPAANLQSTPIQAATSALQNKSDAAVIEGANSLVVKATHKDTLRFWGLIALILLVLAWWKPWQTTAVASASASVVAVAPIVAAPQQVQVNVKIDPIKLEVTQTGK